MILKSWNFRFSRKTPTGTGSEKWQSMAYTPDDYKTDRDGELVQLEEKIDSALRDEAKNRRDR